MVVLPVPHCYSPAPPFNPLPNNPFTPSLHSFHPSPFSTTTLPLPPPLSTTTLTPPPPPFSHHFPPFLQVILQYPTDTLTWCHTNTVLEHNHIWVLWYPLQCHREAHVEGKAAALCIRDC